MKVKVSEATNNQLNWMVAKCIYPHGSDEWLNCISAQEHYCTDWSQGGPIFSGAGIGALFDTGSACRKPSWFATPDDQFISTSYEGEYFDPAFMVSEDPGQYGETELIAKARCFVASRLGETVEVPDDLA